MGEVYMSRSPARPRLGCMEDTMKRIVASLALTAQIGLVGCGIAQRPLPQMPTGTGSTSWRAVASIPQGRLVLVTLEDGLTRRGPMWHVDAETLTMLGSYGPMTVRRETVARIAEEVVVGRTRAPWYMRMLPGLALAGLAGIFIGPTENIRSASGGVLLGSVITTIALAPFAGERILTSRRLVYVRP
jgi:hypothetical protein